MTARATLARKEAAYAADPTCALCGHVIELLEIARIAPYKRGDRVVHESCAAAWEREQTPAPHPRFTEMLRD